MLGGATRGCIGSRGAGGFGFLLFPVRGAPILGFLTLFFLLKLFFLQAFGFRVVRLTLKILSATEIQLSPKIIPLMYMGYPRSQNHRHNSFHVS